MRLDLAACALECHALVLMSRVGRGSLEGEVLKEALCFGVQLMNRAERGRLGGNCGFCSNSILLYFPLSVCLSVHRPDICTFLNYWMI